MDYDLVVVGGGPVGAEVARAVARKGYKVMVFEEHSEIGRPVQCGGLVSGKVLNMARYNDHVNAVMGADIYTPGGNLLSFMAPDPRAYVLDRSHFDKHMMARAEEEATLAVQLGTKVMAASLKDDLVEVRTEHKGGDQGKFTCRLLVGADGVQGNVSKWFKLTRPREIVSGYEVMYEGVDIEPEKATVVAGHEVAPGFFGWVIPHGPDKALVGLGAMDPPRPASELLKDMVATPPIKDLLKGGKPGERMAGCIPIGPIGRSYCDRVMVVGDAAAQVKPLSGGGLYTGLLAAKHCGHVAVKALEGDDCSRKVLKEYEELWQHSIGKEIKNGIMLRKLFLNLTDEQMDDLLDIINHKDLFPLIVNYGDIDSPSILVKVMIKRAPSLLKFTGPLLRALF